MSSQLKAELAATCSTLGRLHKGEYFIEPECLESIKDLVRYLKRDNESHEIRRYLGECKVLQNDLIHIIKSCEEIPDLFDVTLRLLINLTTPTMLFYGEEIPAEKIGRNIYLSLIGYNQDYKVAFCDVEFWSKMCGKLTDLFETEWTERSADDGIQIERILMLLRNVLQVPADFEREGRPENDATVHDKVLWALRQSQILELLLFVSSNQNEEQYYLNLLEIFSLILREQNPKVLARCHVDRSATEKIQETEDLVKSRESEKNVRNKYLSMRNFNATFVMRGVKSLADKDVICHKSLDKATKLEVASMHGKQVRVKKNRIPVESERLERRSAFSVRLFLKEFSLEFLNCGFAHLMGVVKNRLDSGKSLVRDESYYFWALRFFLDLATATDSDFGLIRDCVSAESFHFVQTGMDSAFEHLMAEKKKTVDWVKRIHLILKAYHSLLETLLWMDGSKNPMVRAFSREIKSQIFYVVEYREMTLHVLLKYDSAKFSVSYLRDLIETLHLFIKLLEEFSKQKKFVVQKVKRARSKKKKNKTTGEESIKTKEEKWETIKDEVYDTLSCESSFPEIPPFDAALDIPIDDQKASAMKKIQKLLLDGKVRDGIGLLRSARQVWPENDYFGSEGMAPEEEAAALQEISLADLGEPEEDEKKKETPFEEEEGENEEEEDEAEEDRIRVVEQDFDLMDYKKRLVNKKVVEGCGILLKNYEKNSEHTNHCAIKLLHRIGWECCMPAMLYQASLFWTLLKILKDKTRNCSEINTFTLNLLRKFRKHASKNSIVFLELLFWKEHNVALEIQHGYEPYEDEKKSNRRPRKTKSGKRRKNEEPEEPESLGNVENVETAKKKKPRKNRKKKKDTPAEGLFEEPSANSTEAGLESDVGGDVRDESEDGLPSENVPRRRQTFNSSDEDESQEESQTSDDDRQFFEALKKNRNNCKTSESPERGRSEQNTEVQKPDFGKPDSIANQAEADESDFEFSQKHSFRRVKAFNDGDEDESRDGNQTSDSDSQLLNAVIKNRNSCRASESPHRSQVEQNTDRREPDDLCEDGRSNDKPTRETSKKRVREEDDAADPSPGEDLEWKRHRCIAFDSDSEEDVAVAAAKQPRKRSAVIDSDSDD